MLKRYTIATIGLCSIDKYLVLDSFPHEDEKIVLTSSFESLGGPATNVAIILSKLGNTVPLISVINNSKKLKKEISDKKIIIAGIATSRKKNSVVYILVNQKNGSRTAIAEINAKLFKLNGQQKRIIIETDMIYLDGGIGENILKSIFAIAKKAQTKIFYNLEFYSDKGLSFFKKAEYSLMSQQVANYMVKKSNYVDLLKTLWSCSNKIIGITLGEDGSIFFDGRNIYKGTVYKSTILDTTGAGDAFQSGLLFGIINNWKFDRTVKLASIMAGLNCSVIGANSYNFDIDALKLLLN